MKITVLFNPRKITILYTLYPFWISKFRKEFLFTTNLEWVKKTDKNRKLLLVGWFSGQDKEGLHKQLLEVLSNKYEAISYFDDNDGSESHYLDLLRYFKIYYKKQVFLDRQKYLCDFYGNRIFTDYYHRRLGITESPLSESLPKIENPEFLNKLKVSWNLAYGQYPISKNKRFLARLLFKWTGEEYMKYIFSSNIIHKQLPHPNVLKCQARFGFKQYRASVGFQRKMFLEKIAGNNLFLRGEIPFEEYNKEIKNVSAILSPFGWGEICFRDFEAILNGSVLVKPNMDHVETWPDIYIPNQTYLPVEWDGSNLESQVSSLFENNSIMNEMRTNAWETLRQGYYQMDEKIVEILQDFGQ
jgi:hypothetical protein